MLMSFIAFENNFHLLIIIQSLYWSQTVETFKTLLRKLQWKSSGGFRIHLYGL